MTQQSLSQAKAALCKVRKSTVDVVALGTPHISPPEVRRLACASAALDTMPVAAIE